MSILLTKRPVRKNRGCNFTKVKCALHMSVVLSILLSYGAFADDLKLAQRKRILTGKGKMIDL